MRVDLIGGDPDVLRAGAGTFPSPVGEVGRDRLGARSESRDPAGAEHDDPDALRDRGSRLR